jgi:hypothetical protein
MMIRWTRLLLVGLCIAVLAACTTPQISEIDIPPSPTPRSLLPPTPGGTPEPILQTLPPDEPRPAPVTEVYEGCPPEGDGGDPVLNRLKNRIDVAPWRRASVAAVLALTWPKGIEGRRHGSWSAADRAAVARYEGLPLQIEGYLAGAKKQGPESCNCHSEDYVDYHLWLVDSPAKLRDQSIVIEVTPRVLAQHPGWTITRLRTLMNGGVRVRISGWLMLDQEHPEQLGKTRGSIWEIHPIMEIEVAQFGGWQTLDNLGSAPIPAVPVPTQPDEPPPIVDTPEPGRITPTPNPNGVGIGSTDVKIARIKFDGAKSDERDEYVEIENTGLTAVAMDRWTLSDEAGRTFRWDQFTIQSGQKIRVYTNEVHRDTGGFSFSSSQPIWNNKGDIAYLRDGADNIVATFSYGNSR